MMYNAFTGFNPGRTIYKKGTVVYEGGPELQCDITCDRDVAVTMRDGVKIYIDIFRPANTTEKVPAVLAYGAYGKGTPRKPIWAMPAGDGDSGPAKFEAPDPGFYCPLFLDSSKGTLSAQPATSSSTARYDAKEGQTAFTITFQEDTELTGYSKLVLWVGEEDADEMDIFVSIQKVDLMGNTHNATGGQQRVAVRELDLEKTLSYLQVPVIP